MGFSMHVLKNRNVEQNKKNVKKRGKNKKRKKMFFYIYD